METLYFLSVTSEKNWFLHDLYKNIRFRFTTPRLIEVHNSFLTTFRKKRTWKENFMYKTGELTENHTWQKIKEYMKGWNTCTNYVIFDRILTPFDMRLVGFCLILTSLKVHSICLKGYLNYQKNLLSIKDEETFRRLQKIFHFNMTTKKNFENKSASNLE